MKIRIPHIKIPKFKNSKDINNNEDTQIILTIEVVEYLVREIYNIDWITDIQYKNLIIDKCIKLIKEYLIDLVFDIDKFNIELINEKKNTINKIRNNGRYIINIQQKLDIFLLYTSKNKYHYKLYKALKKNYCFNKVETHEFLNFIINGFCLTYFEQEDEENMIELSILKRYIKLMRKYTVVSFLKQLSDKLQLKIRII